MKNANTFSLKLVDISLVARIDLISLSNLINYEYVCLRFKQIFGSNNLKWSKLLIVLKIINKENRINKIYTYFSFLVAYQNTTNIL